MHKVTILFKRRNSNADKLLWHRSLCSVSALLAAILIFQGNSARAGTALFLGSEYQSNTPQTPPGRGGDVAADPVFSAWLATAGLTTADVSSSTGTTPKAVWGVMSAPAANVSSYGYAIGGTTVTAGISGWNDTTGQPAVSGTAGSVASLSTAGLDGATLQAGAPRPAFARGTGSGYYLGTAGGAANDKIRNGVLFDLSAFKGGGVYSFGIFGGDLETGAPGSPVGFLLLTFTDSTTQTIPYSPDPTLIGSAVWDGNNNISATYGNETTRFIGFVSDDKLIRSALFVVGDDDRNDDGSSEQLSFIAGGVTFLDREGNPSRPLPVPEPGAAALFLLAAVGTGFSRRRAQQVTG